MSFQTPLALVTLVASGIVAGVLFSVALSVVPAFFALPPERYIEVHKLIGRGYDRVMPPMVVTFTVLDVVLAAGTDRVAGRALLGLAAVSGLGVAAVSQLGNVPINRLVKSMPVGDVHVGWPDPRPRWRALHLVRTALAVLALAANAGASVLAH